MKEVKRCGANFVLICVAAAFLSSCTNSSANPGIIARAQKEDNTSIKEVLPGAVIFEPVKSGKETVYHRAFDKDRKLIGAVFKASGKGCSGNIETMAGMLKDGTITAVKVLNQNETSGVGDQIREPAFLGRFVNKKDLNGIQTITGATISSNAVIDSVSKKAARIKGLIENEN